MMWYSRRIRLQYMQCRIWRKSKRRMKLRQCTLDNTCWKIFRYTEKFSKPTSKTKRKFRETVDFHGKRSNRDAESAQSGADQQIYWWRIITDHPSMGGPQAPPSGILVVMLGNSGYQARDVVAARRFDEFLCASV